MKAIQKHEFSVYARGAQPWGEFLNQLEKGSVVKAPAQVHLGNLILRQQHEAKQTEKNVLAHIKKNPWCAAIDIAHALNFSKSGVYRHCKNLVDAGKIQQYKNAENTITFAVNKEKQK